MQENKNSTLSEAIKKTVAQANSRKGANFILLHSEALYSYRYGLPMYWTRWNRQESFSITTSSGLKLSYTSSVSNPALIVCSEKVIDANWTAFDDGELFVIDNNLQYESTSVISLPASEAGNQ